jgi:hypothetical protein
VTPPTPGGHELVLEGPGPHQLARERVVGTPIILNGNICNTRKYLRDVVVAVDVSGSMGMPDAGNDAPVSGSCNRMRAVQSVLADLPADTNVTVFTFGDEVEATSGTVSGRDAALNALAPGDKLVDILCSFRGGSTDFNVAMDEANRVLGAGRPDKAAKELYLVTDGNEQTSGLPAQTHARDVARAMRGGIDINGEKIPAQIGALQVGANPLRPILPDFVSTGSDGAPLLYPVASSDHLAALISATSRNELESASLAIRVASTGSWDNHDLKPLISGDTFSLAPMELSL